MTAADTPHQQDFAGLAEPYRRELKLLCYSMLGSVHEAEDLVQEAFLRAWRGRDGFTGHGSFHGWLYRIATNACLDALARRAAPRRVLPDLEAPLPAGMPAGDPATDRLWLEPYPDLELAGIADAAPGPHARYEMREAVRLAFVAVIQQLPPRQRAVLLLCDVMGWAAGETADLLGGSLASVNSALQRARATLAKQYSGGRPAMQPSTDDRQRALLDRYVHAWEHQDLDGFVALLQADATYAMPPWRQRYRGREAIRAFFGIAWTFYGSFRLVPTSANRQPALAVYSRGKSGAEWHAHSIHLLDAEDDAITCLTAFVRPLGPTLFASFGLPAVFPESAGRLPRLA